MEVALFVATVLNRIEVEEADKIASEELGFIGRKRNFELFGIQRGNTIASSDIIFSGIESAISAIPLNMLTNPLDFSNLQALTPTFSISPNIRTEQLDEGENFVVYVDSDDKIELLARVINLPVANPPQASGITFRWYSPSNREKPIAIGTSISVPNENAVHTFYVEAVHTIRDIRGWGERKGAPIQVGVDVHVDHGIEFGRISDWENSTEEGVHREPVEREEFKREDGNVILVEHRTAYVDEPLHLTYEAFWRNGETLDFNLEDLDYRWYDETNYPEYIHVCDGNEYSVDTNEARYLNYGDTFLYRLVATIGDIEIGRHYVKVTISRKPVVPAAISVTVDPPNASASKNAEGIELTAIVKKVGDLGELGELGYRWYRRRGTPASTPELVGSGNLANTIIATTEEIDTFFYNVVVTNDIGEVSRESAMSEMVMVDIVPHGNPPNRSISVPIFDNDGTDLNLAQRNHITRELQAIQNDTRVNIVRLQISNYIGFDASLYGPRRAVNRNRAVDSYVKNTIGDGIHIDVLGWNITGTYEGENVTITVILEYR